MATNSAISTYKYEPLDLTKQQIRLVTLKPGAIGSPVKCKLEIFDRTLAPPYIALSYTWGPPSPTSPVYINGKTLEVRSNLYDFLTTYRDLPTSSWPFHRSTNREQARQSNVRHLWIDQICISQADTNERNHQVGLMAGVFEGCEEVIIWLGNGKTKIASEFCNRTHSRRDLALELAEDRYFSRLWVVQEIILSPQQRILCGSSWLDVGELISCLNATFEGPRLDSSPAALSYWLLRSGRESLSSNETTLDAILKTFSKQECEDPRDKIYGLMSLVRSDERVSVDYNKSVDEVLVDVVRMGLKSRKRWWLPREYGWLSDLARDIGLPEHVPVMEAMIHGFHREADRPDPRSIGTGSRGGDLTWYYVRGPTGAKTEYLGNHDDYHGKP